MEGVFTSNAAQPFLDSFGAELPCIFQTNVIENAAHDHEINQHLKFISAI